MAIKIVRSKYSHIPKEIGVVSSLTAAQGSLVAHDKTNSKLVGATSSVGTTLTLAGVLVKAIASTETTAEYIPLDKNVYVVIDCTNNTAANQLHKNHVLTDASTLNNTSTSDTTTVGTFFALGLVGAAADKKLFGYFVTVGQVTA